MNVCSLEAYSRPNLHLDGKLALLAKQVPLSAGWLVTEMVSPQVKQMAAVLLRRLLSSSFEEVYPSLTIDMQTAIKTELLTGIQSDSSSNIRKKVCDIAAELARNLIG